MAKQSFKAQLPCPTCGANGFVQVGIDSAQPKYVRVDYFHKTPKCNTELTDAVNVMAKAGKTLKQLFPPDTYAIIRGTLDKN